MGEVTFHCKATSIHPASDPYGNEYVCVEFTIEAQRPPSVVQIPANLPQEISAVVPIISQIPKMLPQAKAYAHRLTIYLTVQEWERLQRRYHFGDEAEVKISSDGSFQLRLI